MRSHVILKLEADLVEHILESFCRDHSAAYLRNNHPSVNLENSGGLCQKLQVVCTHQRKTEYRNVDGSVRVGQFSDIALFHMLFSAHQIIAENRLKQLLFG